MNDLDTHAEFDRLMTDEPPHRPLPDLVRAGGKRLRRRRLAAGAGALAIVAVAGAGITQAWPAGSSPTVRDDAGFAGSTGTSPGTPAAGPDGPSAYTYESGPGCGNTGDWTTCRRYQFKVAGVRDSVVAAVEYRLIDGNSKKVDATDGEYRLNMSGQIPQGYRFDADKGLVDPQGQDADMFAGLTLYAADGSVLGTATSTDSTTLGPYPEYCNLLAKDQPCVRP